MSSEFPEQHLNRFNNAGILGQLANIVDIEPKEYLKVISFDKHSQVWG